MEHEVIEIRLRVTVDAGYPRENAPLHHEIRALAERLTELSSVQDVEATVQHPLDLTRTRTSTRQVQSH